MSISYQKIRGVVEALPDDVLVVDMEQGERRRESGLILGDDTSFGSISDADARVASGVRPRWAQVYKIGKNVDYVKVGEYVMVAHGRWTYAVDFIDDETNVHYKLQKIDAKDILLVSEEMPEALVAYKRKA